MSKRYSRRQFLISSAAIGSPVIAGCTELLDDEDVDRSPTPTPTPPTILDYSVDPVDNGTSLEVSLTAESGRELETVLIEYGERVLSEQPEDESITLEGVLADTHLTGAGSVAFRIEDVDGQAAEATYNPDATEPSISIKANATPTAGELVVTIETEDDVGLAEVTVLVEDEEGATFGPDSVGGNQAYQVDRSRVSVEEISAADPGRSNTISGRARDWNGNESESDAETYVRKYDTMEDTRLDIGAVYIPFAGDGLVRCLDDSVEAEPDVGEYFKPIPAEVTSQHIDQMTGHGIGRTMFNFVGGDDRAFGMTEEFLDSDIVDQIDVEPFYGAIAFYDESRGENLKDDVFPRDLSFIRDNFLGRDNVSKHEGRPVVSLWNVNSVAAKEEKREEVMEDFGSYSAFVEEIRSYLQVDGTNPWLVGGAGTIGPGLQDDTPASRLLKEFDAIQTWFPETVQSDDAGREETLQAVEEDFRASRKFAEDNGMEFIPMIFPGYNENGNTCYGRGRRIPRSQQLFTQLLELAEQYRTTDRINIASWNDWAEGHQIEPATYRGTDYGTGYLEVVEEFQRAGQ